MYNSEPLTERTQKLLALIADETTRNRIETLFKEEAAMFGPPTEAVIERIRFAVIKLALQNASNGRSTVKNRLNNIEALYRADTRDLLMVAEFFQVKDHDVWAASMLEEMR